MEVFKHCFTYYFQIENLANVCLQRVNSQFDSIIIEISVILSSICRPKFKCMPIGGKKNTVGQTGIAGNVWVVADSRKLSFSFGR